MPSRFDRAHLDPAQHLTGPDRLVRRLEDLTEDAGGGCGDLHRHLVGRDLEHRLVPGDGLAHVLEPRPHDHLGLLYRFGRRPDRYELCDFRLRAVTMSESKWACFG